jgi:threonine aldolase
MFGSDNQAPAHDAVIAAIVEANCGRAGSYGDDLWSARALEAVKTVFETDDLDFYQVGTGGAANGLGLSMLCPPWGAVLALWDAHVIADEAGGPEHFTSGARMIGIGAGSGRLLPQHLEEAGQRFSPANINSPQPRAVTISNLSENGLTYSSAHVAALANVCRQYGWSLHMDGARFANAVASTGETAADLTWRAGVDAVSLGLTKTGAACAEALIVFGSARNNSAAYLRKRAGHLFSKQRYMSAQFVAMLEGGLWLDLAVHANNAASTLATEFEKAGCKLAFLVDGNEVFVHLNMRQVEALTSAKIGFYPWAPAGKSVYRFVTCWQTSAHDVALVTAALLAASSSQATG